MRYWLYKSVKDTVHFPHREHVPSRSFTIPSGGLADVDAEGSEGEDISEADGLGYASLIRTRHSPSCWLKFSGTPSETIEPISRC